MKKLEKLKMQKDYWFPSPNYVNTYARRRSIAKIFDFEYEDKLISNPQVMWGSNTAQPRRTYTIPVGNVSKKSALQSLKSLMKKYI